VRVQSDSVFGISEWLTYGLLTCLWVAANLLFWAWWLQPGRMGDPLLYGLLTAAWAYEATILPSTYLFFVGRMRQPRHMPASPNQQVALITLCVPSQETLEIIEAQLAAMVAVHYPHDSWILDEGNDPAVRAAAERHGVRYFSRKGIDRYNQAVAPFKAKTKAGNVNAWLDAHGAAYEFFVQLDIDHRPRPDYLVRVLGYFADEQVAWVQAPSLYANLDAGWVARGAAEQELVLQGPLQRGFFGHSETPFIIGSHCTYRMSAINSIGGFQPTRAEDHLDTVMLAARGYRGVFVPEAIAMGGGPETFETYLRQQFAWALSMMQVLIGFTPRLLRSYRPRQALQLLFAQTWYPLWSTSMLVLFAMPLLALISGREPARSALWEFGVASAPLMLAAFVVWRWTRRWQLPQGLGLSWRGMVLHIARWPIVFWALINVLLRIRHPYMITPKGDTSDVPAFPLRTQAIYLVGALLGLAAVWQYLLRNSDDNVEGYALFALLGVTYMLCVVVANVSTDLVRVRRRGLGFLGWWRLRALALLAAGVTCAGLVFTGCATHEQLVASATWTGKEAAGASGTPGAAAARQVLEATLAASTDSRASTGVSDASTWIDAMTGGATDLLSTTTAEGQAHTYTSPSSLAELDAVGGQPVIGAYDPWQHAADLPLGIEQWYVRQDDPHLFEAALDHADGHRVAMITIEPFPRRSGTPVLEKITSGSDDDQLKELARLVAVRQPQVVLLRWGHEMDLSGLYPWGSNNPSAYRAAFQHVVTVFRDNGATNARWVWSPAGEPGARAYYPGDDFVDYAGLTVLGDADWDWNLGFQTPRSMADILRPRYAEVADLGKPILLAEVGCSGTPEQQAAWLQAGMASLSQFQLVRGVVYFDDRNAPNNNTQTEPDWQLTPQVLASLADTRATA
jgi:cellulose synthase (UDP-forming)